MHVVVGADIGGTSTRVVLLGTDGTVRGTGRAGGGNLRSSAPGDVTRHLADALRAAWSAAADEPVADAAHLGVAGAGAAGRSAAAAVVRAAWAEAGVPAPRRAPAVGDDLEIAFASAADGDDGLLLLAGTGAVACRVVAGRTVARADGLGWLLGDEGSAVWLGVAALRAVAADLDGRGPATALTPAVARELGVPLPEGGDGPRPAPVPSGGRAPATDDPRQALVAAAHAVAPARHGHLAPLVTRAAEAGDPVAARLVADGAAALLRTAGAALAGHPAPREVVVAGSLLTSPGPVAGAVLPALAERLGVPVRRAGAPVVGALLRAAADAGWPAPDRDRVTAALPG